MVVNAKALLHLPVRTRGGVALGKISGVELETDTGRMSTLLVKAVGGVLGKELRVAWAQIVLLSDKETVVEDAVVPVKSAGMVLEGADI